MRSHLRWYVGAGAARANENLMPVLIANVKAYATLGEICETLREVYGVYQSIAVPK